jgi:hypothetical protein
LSSRTQHTDGSGLGRVATDPIVALSADGPPPWLIIQESSNSSVGMVNLVRIVPLWTISSGTTLTTIDPRLEILPRLGVGSQFLGSLAADSTDGA